MQYLESTTLLIPKAKKELYPDAQRIMKIFYPYHLRHLLVMFTLKIRHFLKLEERRGVIIVCQFVIFVIYIICYKL